MKFAYLTMIVLCLLTSTSWSTSNPLIRNCNLATGEFTVVEVANDTSKTNTTTHNQWGLCKFDKAYVGALDVMLFSTKYAAPISFAQYANNNTICNGKTVEANILQSNKVVWLCKYEDNSLVDLDTLHTGPSSSENFKLNKYLGMIPN